MDNCVFLLLISRYNKINYYIGGVVMDITNKYDLHKEAKERVKEIVMRMNGLTEEEVINKYILDINFNRGFDVLVDVFMQAKFNK